MRRKGLPLLFLFFFSSMPFVQAQDIEAGLLLGTAQYQGDLSKQQYTLSETKPGFGGLFRYYFNPKFNLKASIMYGQISGDDANYDDEKGRKRRNLSFRSHILEGSVQLEYNILPYVNNTELYKWAPYVFTGVSVFNFNPKAEYQGETYELQPLGTEGQGTQGEPDKYNLTQLSIPLGVGLKYSVGSGWNIGLEAGLRKTFTDYLDDVSSDYPDPSVFDDGSIANKLYDRSDEVEGIDQQVHGEGSQRGNPDDDDWYTFFGFTITKTFRETGCMNFY